MGPPVEPQIDPVEELRLIGNQFFRSDSTGRIIQLTNSKLCIVDAVQYLRLN